MSIDVKNDTITVAGTTYDVERNDEGDHTLLTLAIDGEPVFEGIEGRVGYDEFASEHADPRDWSNVGTMLVNYRGYKLGDGENDEFEVTCPRCEGDGEDPDTHELVLRRMYGREVIETGTDEAALQAKAATLNEKPVDGSVYDVEIATCAVCEGSGEIELDPASYYRQERGARVVLPLYVYEHSGITIRAGEPLGETLTRNDVRSTGRFVGDDAGWDTSFVGFTFDTPEGVEQCLGADATDEEIIAALKGEVEIYASFLEGDVTDFVVTDDETNFHESCGGFVGGWGEETMVEAFGAMESAIEARLAENAERANAAARDIETV